MSHWNRWVQDVRFCRRARRYLGAREDIYWGPETKWLGDERYKGDRQLENPLGAVQMGLIYVNPEARTAGPIQLPRRGDIARRSAHGNERLRDCRAHCRRSHVRQGSCAADPSEFVGPEPEGAAIEEQGLGWKNSLGNGNNGQTITSGLEGAWTTNPVKWDNNYFENLFGYDWKLTEESRRCEPVDSQDPSAAGTVPMPTIQRNGMHR